MKHYACYWCHALVPEDRAVAARLNGATYFWHRECSTVDPLYPVQKTEQYRVCEYIHDE